MKAASPELQDAYHEAYSRPAIKTPPSNFATVEAAEAAGWEYDKDLGRWLAPSEVSKNIKELEKLIKIFTPEFVNAMSVHQLREALQSFGQDERTVATLSEEELRQVVKEVASELQQKARTVRKNKLAGTVLGANAKGDGQPVYIVLQNCHSCGKLPPAGKKLMICSQCRNVSYCNKECQKADWSNHKAYCKRSAADQHKSKSLVEDSSAKNLDKVIAWYQSVPNLPERVVCLAWQHRRESPFIRVKGGVDARLATCEVVPRSIWSKADSLLGMKVRFAQSDFRQDVHYFAVISAGHAGAKSWPAATPRMRFPLPPQQMDAWVTATMARAPMTKLDYDSWDA